MTKFHYLFQSDIVHQSVYELVHSEDREELQKQLMWNSFLPAEHSGITLQEAILPENSHLLERNFTVRFRCLLDNTSGFLVSFYRLHAYLQPTSTYRIMYSVRLFYQHLRIFFTENIFDILQWSRRDHLPLSLTIPEFSFYLLSELAIKTASTH